MLAARSSSCSKHALVIAMVIAALVSAACAPTATSSAVSTRSPLPTRSPPDSVWPPKRVIPTPAPVESSHSLPGTLYTDKAGGFTFHYPSTWTVIRFSPGSVAAYPPPGDPHNTSALVSVGVLPMSTGTTLKERRRWELRQDAKSPAIHVSGVRSTTLGGLPAYVVNETPPIGSPWIAEISTTMWRDIAYSVDYTVINTAHGTYAAGAALVVRSFRIIPR
jgi:hypothetical protein